MFLDVKNGTLYIFFETLNWYWIVWARARSNSFINQSMGHGQSNYQKASKSKLIINLNKELAQDFFSWNFNWVLATSADNNANRRKKLSLLKNPFPVERMVKLAPCFAWDKSLIHARLVLPVSNSFDRVFEAVRAWTLKLWDIFLLPKVYCWI